MTKVEMFEHLMNSYPLSADEKAFLEHERRLATRRHTSVRKPTVRQTANVTLSADILAEMESGKAYLVSDMVSSFACMPTDANLQRVTNIMTKLVKEGKATRTIMADGKAVFSRN